MVNDRSSDTPALRLVDAPALAGAHASPRRNTAEPSTAAPTTENAGAALSSTDARWVFAVRVAVSLGAGGLLGPERRRRLVSLAQGMGLRPFDANLIIAIVQDSARTGRGPLAPAVADRVAMITPPGARPVSRASLVLAAAASVIAAAAIAAIAVSWILGAA